ncbi:MAG: hypothetical protein HQM12_01555 [SAR324 cluster bacterium]|nr:hypothetical protein [SAR324 cluster bacterium]
MDLSHIPDTAIRGDVLVKTTLLMMKHIDDRDLPRFLFGTLFPMLWDYSRSKTGLEYLETLLYYLFKASPNLEKDAFIEEFHKLPNPELLEEVVMPTMAQQWIDEVFERGIEKGRLAERILTAQSLEELFRL